MVITKDIPLVVHIIYDLQEGGMENGLINLINRTPPDRYRHAIVSLQGAGEFAGRIENKDLPIITLQSGEGHSFGLYKRVWKILHELQPRIVHTRNLATLEAQVPARFMHGVKTVHGEHGRDVFDLDGKNIKYNLLRRLIKPFVGKYIAVSKDLEQWLQSTVGVSKKRIAQIYNGVDQIRFHASTGKNLHLVPDGFMNSRSIVIGNVGRLAAVKDQKTLITAFGLLSDSVPEYSKHLRLIIVGDGPLRSSLEQHIQKLGLEKSVWLTGIRDDISDLLRLMDMFVLPSLGEGISNTVLEAMATGLPIIATKVGGNPELVQDMVNGRLVPVGDSQILADVMGELIKQQDKLNTMGQYSLERVREHFGWDRTIAEYLAVYDELLGR